jgi:hypothetical protein
LISENFKNGEGPGEIKKFFDERKIFEISANFRVVALALPPAQSGMDRKEGGRSGRSKLEYEEGEGRIGPKGRGKGEEGREVWRRGRKERGGGRLRRGRRREEHP